MPLFAKLSQGELFLLATLAESVQFAEEDEIVREGALGDSMYLLEEGSCKVFVKGIGLVNQLQEGDYFGEVAIVDAPASYRTATVKATLPTTCLRISQGNVHRTLTAEKCKDVLQYEKHRYDARAALKKSPLIDAAVGKLWTLMVFESARLDAANPRLAAAQHDNPTDAAGFGKKGPSVWNRARKATVKKEQNVTREGYTQMHLRISKVLNQSTDLDSAMAIAGIDWAEDITAYSGDSKVDIWLEEVKKKLREATAVTVTKLGWEALFAEYDDDGSGEISIEEFISACRDRMALSPEVLSDKTIDDLFRSADADGGGTMDLEEFLAWAGSWGKLPEGGRVTPHVEACLLLLDASTSIVNKIGWIKLFQKYDTDGGGSLEFDEFNTIVREDCGIKEKTVDESGLKELFNAVDLDGGGTLT